MRAAKRRLAAVGGVAHEPYVALFCPHCGEHINEVDDQDAPDVPPPPNLGSQITCGWCGMQTRDWNHVLRCRRTHKARADLVAIQQAMDDTTAFRRSQRRLRRMLDEVDE